MRLPKPGSPLSKGCCPFILKPLRPQASNRQKWCAAASRVLKHGNSSRFLPSRVRICTSGPGRGCRLATIWPRMPREPIPDVRRKRKRPGLIEPGPYQRCHSLEHRTEKPIRFPDDPMAPLRPPASDPILQIEPDADRAPGQGRHVPLGHRLWTFSLC